MARTKDELNRILDRKLVEASRAKERYYAHKEGAEGMKLMQEAMRLEREANDFYARHRTLIEGEGEQATETPAPVKRREDDERRRLAEEKHRVAEERRQLEAEKRERQAEAERQEAARRERRLLRRQEQEKASRQKAERAEEEIARIEAEKAHKERLAKEESARLEAERQEIERQRLEARKEAARVEEARMRARQEADRLEAERRQLEISLQEKRETEEALRIEREMLERERKAIALRTEAPAKAPQTALETIGGVPDGGAPPKALNRLSDGWVAVHAEIKKKAAEGKVDTASLSSKNCELSLWMTKGSYDHAGAKWLDELRSAHDDFHETVALRVEGRVRNPDLYRANSRLAMAIRDIPETVWVRK
ncbi:hypothetical protein [Serratia nevei]|uniref:hypothetical protein n=1 Tax=Serratia nevei TaxID=2703794 RepID=UPI00254C7FC0|nr:hypothetical protein [Serratia nevei]MDK5165513.1 hypothetical protein [Serratia nevei]